MENTHNPIQKLKYLAGCPEPAATSYLKPEGFTYADEEYAFFYETHSLRHFLFPDGIVRPLRLLNYYWEALEMVVSRVYGVDSRQLIQDIWAQYDGTTFTEPEIIELAEWHMMKYVHDKITEYDPRL